MTNIHESEKLNALLGKRVKIVFFDGDEEIGILGRSNYSQRYKITRNGKGDLCFYKTHVKSIKEA